MKPRDVVSVLMAGSEKQCLSSLLMEVLVFNQTEGAIHYAELGHSVLYISAKEFQSLPPPIHGLPKPTPDVFSLIRFMYLPHWQDLLQHLFSLHMHSHVPSVLIVETIEAFVSNGFEAPHFALLFASLLDGAAVCANRSKSKSYLIVSVGQDIPHPLAELFFTDIVCLYHNKKEDKPTDKQTIIMKISGAHCPEARTFGLNFITDTGSLVLSEVSFWETCHQIFIDK